uniref:Odorant binding protein n=1 Tax=Anopheles atroparvus TaxID=41427 RepID=A0A8W7MWM8_ANOAO
MMSRLVFSCALVLVLGALAAHANDTKGVVVEKSFLQSVQDCVEYLRIPKLRLVQYLAYEFPPDEETKCLIYCVGTDLRWWNETCGLQFPAIVNFFQPVLGDRQYEKRTKECVERTTHAGKQQNSCCQAYETFQCYLREFGNLVTCPQYVPPTKLQATQAALDCLTMLRVPVDLLRCYSRGELPDEPETRYVYHCFDLRTGLYTPETGLQLSRFYVRDLATDDLRYLSKETKNCRDRIRQSGCNACSEVYQTHQECLAGLGEEGYTAGVISEAAKIALANLGVCCSEPAVEPVPVVIVPEPVGYSYASYQPMAEHPCKVCTAQKPVPVLAPSPQVVNYNPPPRSQCSCEAEPNVVAPAGLYPSVTAGGMKSYPFVKDQPGHQSKLHHYTTPEVSPCPSPPAAFKPTFSAFSVRPFGQRAHGPYPTPGYCKSKS